MIQTEVLAFGQAGRRGKTCCPEGSIFLSSVSGSRLSCLRCMENITHDTVCGLAFRRRCGVYRKAYNRLKQGETNVVTITYREVEPVTDREENPESGRQGAGRRNQR